MIFAAAVSWLEGIGETDQLGLYYFSEDDFEGLAACKADNVPGLYSGGRDDDSSSSS